jgi:hypothetical protein
MATGRRYELVCWLAAAILALALALMHMPTLGRPADAIAAAPTPAPHLTIYQQHCIDRILTRAVGKSEEAVVAEINQVCLAIHRTTVPAAAGSIAVSCGLRVGVPLAPAFRPFSGCLGG